MVVFLVVEEYQLLHTANDTFFNILHLCKDMGIELSPEIIDFVAGSVAGAVSVAVGQPFDTVKVSATDWKTTSCHVL